MAARLAGSSHFQRRASERRRRMSIALITVVAIVIAGVVGKSVMDSGKSPQTPARNSQPQLSYSAKQAQDVNLVAGAVGQYSAANDALPKRLAVSNGSLVLCGAACDSTAYEVGGFSVYQTANIRILGYSPSLTVPSQNDMYLVPGAKCGKDGGIGSINPNPRSMVLLFVSTSNTTMSPRCVVL